MLRYKKWLIPALVISGIDILVTCLFVYISPFIDREDWIIIQFFMALVCINLLTLVVALVMRIIFKKWSYLPLTPTTFIIAIAIEVCGSFCLFTVAQKPDLMHVCLFMPFEKNGQRYILLMDETNWSLHQNSRYYIFDDKYFKYSHDSYYMCCKGPYITTGRYTVINDSLVSLHNSAADMAIVSRNGINMNVYFANGVPDLYAMRYLYGFPKKTDTATLGIRRMEELQFYSHPPSEPATTLHQNSPNPFTGKTNISFNMSKPGYAHLTVFTGGSNAAILTDGNMSAGLHTIPFNADTLPAGTYLYQLTTTGEVATKWMVVTK